MLDLLPPCDLLAGMEMGGIPIATVMSQVSSLPTVFVRKEAKSYGTRKLVEGVQYKDSASLASRTSLPRPERCSTAASPCGKQGLSSARRLRY